MTFSLHFFLMEPAGNSYQEEDERGINDNQHFNTSLRAHQKKEVTL
jgi:hypothetical protein